MQLGLAEIREVLEPVLGWILNDRLWPSAENFNTGIWLAKKATWVMFAIIVLEFLFPHRRYRPGRRTWLTSVYFVLGTKVALFAIIVAPALQAVFKAWGLPSLHLNRHLSAIPLALVTLLASTFVDYWAHRWLHRSPLLWHIHKIHHAHEDLNWATRFHNHFAMQIVHAPLWVLTAALLGAEYTITYIGTILITIDYFQHANVRLHFGPLNWLISTPEVHRFHHSTDPAHYDTNFGGTLMIWDHVFGTYMYDKHNPPRAYGLEDSVPQSFVGQQIQPLVWIARDLRQKLFKPRRRDTPKAFSTHA